MAERKVFNYQSVVLPDMTLENEGFDPRCVGYQKKYIWARCRYCGEPHRVRGSNFKKAGSACHKKCRLKEQSESGSPFSDPEVRHRAQKNRTKNISQEELNKRISEGRKRAQKQIEETCLKKYGVSNPFQSEKIKDRIKRAHLSKRGVDHHMKDPDIQEDVKRTLIERYGHDNLQHIPEFNEAMKTTWRTKVDTDEDGKYILINTLRSSLFWSELREGKSLREVCESLNLPYQTCASLMSRDEFKDRFREVYAYPRTQKQQSIKEFILSLGLSPESNNRSLIPPMELDIYIPEKEFAIEFHGSYWHSEACLDPKTARKKQKNKLDACRRIGIGLFQIFEKHWDDREYQVKNFLKSKLGLNNRRLFARKCEIDESPQRDFIERNHIQGYGNRTIKYFNLMHCGEIVASMTASSHHRQNVSGKPIVLNRLCFAEDVSVAGGSSKLFKYFAKWAQSEGYDSVISWSDNLWTEGEVYGKMGFSLENESKEDYFYWDMKSNQYRSKQSQRKSATGCPDNMTEREWCLQRGLYRIWDCGKKKWVHHLKRNAKSG